MARGSAIATTTVRRQSSCKTRGADLSSFRDRISFALLRGSINSEATTAQNAPIDNDSLAKATISFTGSAVHENGERTEPATRTIAMRTFKAAEHAQLTIRDADGEQTEFLTLGHYNDILGHMWIPAQFLRSGEWTFEVVAKLEDETCLFAMTFTQYLVGKLRG